MKRMHPACLLVAVAGCAGDPGLEAQPNVERASPRCDGDFHFVEVPGAVCADGSPTGFQYVCQAGLTPSAPLLVFFEGGGACWSGDTCNCMPDSSGLCTNPDSTISRFSFSREDSYDGQAWEDSLFGQEAAFAGPTSPIDRAWNIVHVPYCTGDVHIGDRVVTYTTSEGRPLTVHHVGFRNDALDVAVAEALFPNPLRVAAFGGSAGGIGVDCHLANVRAAWPEARMYEMNNAGAPLRAPHVPDVPAVALSSYGAYHVGPHGRLIGDTCPILPAPNERAYSPGLVMRYNRYAFPDVRKAFTDDYADGVMDGFSCELGATPDRDGSCADAVRASMLDAYTIDIVGRPPPGTDGNPTYRVYFHEGTCHDEREATGGDEDCDYDTMVQDDVVFRDWFRGWLEVPPYAWEDVL